MCLPLPLRNLVILVDNFYYYEYDTLRRNPEVNPFVMKFIFKLKNNKFKQSFLRLFSLSIPKTMTVDLCFESPKKTAVYLKGNYRL